MIRIMGKKDLFDLSTKSLGYMVVKYRTNHSGGVMEFFVQRADGVNPTRKAPTPTRTWRATATGTPPLPMRPTSGAMWTPS